MLRRRTCYTTYIDTKMLPYELGKLHLVCNTVIIMVFEFGYVFLRAESCDGMADGLSSGGRSFDISESPASPNTNRRRQLGIECEQVRCQKFQHYPPCNAKSCHGDEYKSTWHRWQSIPSFLEERRRQLLHKNHQPTLDHKPTQEALDFFESLLSGTEPEQDEKPNTSDGAAQLLEAARRLQKQAEGLRTLRQGAKVFKPMPSMPREKVENLEQFEPFSDQAFEEREASRRLEHQRKLKELETAAAVEREKLLAEIHQEQNDAAARRHAQQVWFEDFSPESAAAKGRCKRSR